MKRLSIRTAVAALAAIVSVPLAFAQGSRVLRVNVPFAFVAQEKTCPAGVYTFSQAQGHRLLMSNPEARLSVSLPVVTALARSSSEDDHVLAFDKVGDQRILSEVWLPERDGALVHITQGEHSHEIIRLKTTGGTR